MKLVHLRAGRFSFVWHREPHHVISRSCDCVCLFHSVLVFLKHLILVFSAAASPLLPSTSEAGLALAPSSFRAQWKATGTGLFGLRIPQGCAPPPCCSLNGSRIQPRSQREHKWEEKKITETPLLSERFPGTCPWKPHGSRGRRPKEILSLCSPVPADALPDGGSLLFHVCSFASEKKKN